MEWSGGCSSSGVDRDMLEKWDETDNCNDIGLGGNVGLSFGGGLGLFGVDIDKKKLPVDAVLSPSLLLSRSDMYLAMSSRISSGDKMYCNFSSAVSKASSSSSPEMERDGDLEVIA